MQPLARLRRGPGGGPTTGPVLGPLVGLGGVLAGASVVVPAVLLHQSWWWLALAVVATTAACVGLPPGWARVGFAAGWAGVLAVLVGTRPEGDYLVPARAGGYVLMVVALVILMVALVTMPARTPPPARVGEPSDGREDQGPTTDRT